MQLACQASSIKQHVLMLIVVIGVAKCSAQHIPCADHRAVSGMLPPCVSCGMRSRVLTLGRAQSCSCCQLAPSTWWPPAQAQQQPHLNSGAASVTAGPPAPAHVAQAGQGQQRGEPHSSNTPPRPCWHTSLHVRPRCSCGLPASRQGQAQQPSTQPGSRAGGCR